MALGSLFHIGAALDACKRGGTEFRLIGLAVIVGLLAAYGSLLFRYAIDAVSWLFYGTIEEEMPLAAAAMAAWHVLLITSLGGLAIGLACRFLLPSPMPQGVADVIEASALRSGRMSWRHGAAAAGLSAFSIGIGGSTGREGPIVHLSATLASLLVKRLQLSPALARTLLGSAVASGVAAAFHAPIAGVIFALEVVVGHYGIGAFAPVVIASLMGTIVTRVHIGAEPAFGIGVQHVQSLLEVPAFLLLGLVSGLIAILLMRGIGWVRLLHEKAQLPVWARPALAGLALGGIAIFEPQVLGIGYAATTQALNNQTALETLLILGAAKALATAICLGSGFGGGIFSPSLAVGAIAGGAFGLIAAALFPELGSQPSVYAVIGMAAVAAATLGAPLSTIIMIFELTTDYGVTFAIMAAVAIASFITRIFYGRSFFHWQLQMRGVDTESGQDYALLRARRVSGAMRADHITLDSQASFEDVRACFNQYHRPIFVIEKGQTLTGIIEFEDLADAALSGQEQQKLGAGAICRRASAILTPEDNLAWAMELCQRHKLDHIPIVRDKKSRELLGELRYSDTVRAYNTALLNARAIEQGRV